MADEIQSNIRVNIDTAGALDSIKALQAQLSAFHSQMSKAGAASAAQASSMQQNLINSLNSSNKFSAQVTSIKSSTEAFTTALEKNKLSMGEYFRYAAASSKSFGNLFKREFDTIQQVAVERVKTLQTQYIKLGRDANGAMQAIKVRPLTLDMENLGTKTAIAAQKQQILNKLLEQGSTNLLNFGKNTQWAGRQLMVGFTIPLTMFAGAAIKSYQQIEQQMVMFKRVYGDFSTSAAETDKMAKQVQNLANQFTKYGIAVKDTLDMAAQAAAAGQTGNQLLSTINQASRLSALGGVSQQKALETTISLTNAFKISAKDLGTTMDYLNAVQSQTVLSIDDITTAIPKAAPVVKQLGGNVQDLAFFLTAMKQGGINASQGANALKSGLSSMINPTAAASKMLESFGINIKGIVNQDKGNLRKTVTDLATALDKLDPLNRAKAIETLFGKFQFARISALLTNVVDPTSQAATAAKLSMQTQGQLHQLAERELAKTAASPMYQFQKSLQDFQVAMAPIGETFLKIVTPILNGVNGILKGFNSLSPGMKSGIVGFVSVVAGLGPIILMTFGLIANGVANIIKGFAKLKNFFNGVTNSTDTLGEQTRYMTQQQLEAASVAASLDQVHSKLRQTFTVEAESVNVLTAAYQRAAAAQREMGGYTPSTPVRKYATGGIISGPGTGTSDSILARLSAGEAVIPAAQVSKHPQLVKNMIAGNLPGYASGGIVSLGMPAMNMEQLMKRIARQNQLEEITQEVFNSPLGRVRPTDFGEQIAKTTGHSFPSSSVGGVYRKPDGTMVFVKPMTSEKAALAEMRGTQIAREVHGLIAPKQTLRVMQNPNDPSGHNRFFVLESPLDPRIASPGSNFTKQDFFKQLVASLLRGDKDLGPGNLGSNVLADVGTAGVFSQASGMKSEYSGTMPSMEEQAMVNLLGVKGGAKKFFAQATSSIARSMSPSEYHTGIINEINNILPKLESTIGSMGLSKQEMPYYQAMIERLRAGKNVNWSNFQGVHAAVPGFAKGGIVGNWLTKKLQQKNNNLNQNADTKNLNEKIIAYGFDSAEEQSMFLDLTGKNYEKMIRLYQLDKTVYEKYAKKLLKYKNLTKERQDAILNEVNINKMQLNGTLPADLDSPLWQGYASYGGTSSYKKRKKFATGGIFSGPGTGTSDSILARVSNGEAIIPANSVARHPELVNSLISGGIPGFKDGVVYEGSHGSQTNPQNLLSYLQRILEYKPQLKEMETILYEVERSADGSLIQNKKKTTIGEMAKKSFTELYSGGDLYPGTARVESKATNQGYNYIPYEGPGAVKNSSGKSRVPGFAMTLDELALHGQSAAAALDQKLIPKNYIDAVQELANKGKQAALILADSSKADEARIKYILENTKLMTQQGLVAKENMSVEKAQIETEKDLKIINSQILAAKQIGLKGQELANVALMESGASMIQRFGGEFAATLETKADALYAVRDDARGKGVEATQSRKFEREQKIAAGERPSRRMEQQRGEWFGEQRFGARRGKNAPAVATFYENSSYELQLAPALEYLLKKEVDGVKKGMTNALKIKSPSKEAEYVGKMAATGYLNGLNSNILKMKVAGAAFGRAAITPYVNVLKDPTNIANMTKASRKILSAGLQAWQNGSYLISAPIVKSMTRATVATEIATNAIQRNTVAEEANAIATNMATSTKNSENIATETNSKSGILSKFGGMKAMGITMGLQMGLGMLSGMGGPLADIASNPIINTALGGINAYQSMKMFMPDSKMFGGVTNIGKKIGNFSTKIGSYLPGKIGQIYKGMNFAGSGLIGPMEGEAAAGGAALAAEGGLGAIAAAAAPVALGLGVVALAAWGVKTAMDNAAAAEAKRIDNIVGLGNAAQLTTDQLTATANAIGYTPNKTAYQLMLEGINPSTSRNGKKGQTLVEQYLSGAIVVPGTNEKLIDKYKPQIDQLKNKSNSKNDKMAVLRATEATLLGNGMSVPDVQGLIDAIAASGGIKGSPFKVTSLSSSTNALSSNMSSTASTLNKIGKNGGILKVSDKVNGFNPFGDTDSQKVSYARMTIENDKRLLSQMKLQKLDSLSGHSKQDYANDIKTQTQQLNDLLFSPKYQKQFKLFTDSAVSNLKSLSAGLGSAQLDANQFNKSFKSITDSILSLDKVSQQNAIENILNQLNIPTAQPQIYALTKGLKSVAAQLEVIKILETNPPDTVIAQLTADLQKGGPNLINVLDKLATVSTNSAQSFAQSNPENAQTILNKKITDIGNAQSILQIIEDKINKTYQARIDALSKISQLNQGIAQSQKDQLSLASALSKGDIAAAASAALTMQQNAAQNSLQLQQQSLQDQQTKSVNSAGIYYNGQFFTSAQLKTMSDNASIQSALAASPSVKRAPGSATGGHIKGPGTGTSDSIPAMLSNGEYVIRANAVKAIGVDTLNKLNQADRNGFKNGGYNGYANGGAVNPFVDPMGWIQGLVGGVYAGGGNPSNYLDNTAAKTIKRSAAWTGQQYMDYGINPTDPLSWAALIPGEKIVAIVGKVARAVKDVPAFNFMKNIMKSSKEDTLINKTTKKDLPSFPKNENIKGPRVPINLIKEQRTNAKAWKNQVESAFFNLLKSGKVYGSDHQRFTALGNIGAKIIKDSLGPIEISLPKGMDGIFTSIKDLTPEDIEQLTHELVGNGKGGFGVRDYGLSKDNIKGLKNIIFSNRPSIQQTNPIIDFLWKNGIIKTPMGLQNLFNSQQLLKTFDAFLPQIGIKPQVIFGNNSNKASWVSGSIYSAPYLAKMVGNNFSNALTKVFPFLTNKLDVGPLSTYLSSKSAITNPQVFQHEFQHIFDKITSIFLNKGNKISHEIPPSLNLKGIRSSRAIPTAKNGTAEASATIKEAILNSQLGGKGLTRSYTNVDGLNRLMYAMEHNTLRPYQATSEWFTSYLKTIYAARKTTGLAIHTDEELSHMQQMSAFMKRYAPATQFLNATDNRTRAIQIYNNLEKDITYLKESKTAKLPTKESFTLEDLQRYAGIIGESIEKIKPGIGNKFAMGGLITKYFAKGGYAMGTDTVPAMLTPGEFVIRKSAVDAIGSQTLNKINSFANGGTVGGSDSSTWSKDSVYNYSINVNVATGSNPNDIASAVMSQIKQIDAQRVRGNVY
jgi:TP901 family phage tail tape measure protein